MAEINSTNGGSDAVAATAALITNRFVGDAFVGHLIACISFASFFVLCLLGGTWYGLVVAILNAFNLWFWVPKTIFAYRVWKLCKQRSAK